MTTELWCSVIVIIISVAVNIIQAILTHQRRRVFRAIMLGAQRQLGQATYSAQSLRQHTQMLAKPAAEIDHAAIRAMSLLAGDMYGYTVATSEQLQGFSREYLKMDLPTSRQVLEEFRGNANEPSA